MRYTCLVHFDPAVMQSPEFDKAALDRRSKAYDEELKAGGHFLGWQGLALGDAAVIVRIRDGKMLATDGPYIESKEQMAGFVLLEARDMNEAVRLAAGLPLAEIGAIEVRPIVQSSSPPPQP
jgi:hypothetical protein